MAVLVRRMGAGSRLRVAIGALVMALALAQQAPLLAYAGTLLVVLTEVVPLTRLGVRTVIVAQLVTVIVTIVGTVSNTQAVMPLLLVPAFRAGEQLDVSSVLVERGLGAALTGGGLLLWPDARVAMGSLLVPLLQWWFLGLALGLLAAWARRVQPVSPRSEQQLAAHEAVRLSGRLQSVARALPLGLDASAVGQTLVDEVHALAAVDVCAVLLRIDEETASPLALRGATRLPWRDPSRSQGALHQAWSEQNLVIQIREPDPAGRRRGSSMACVPVFHDRQMIALLVLERRAATGFEGPVLEQVIELAATIAPQLQAALTFGELQRSATVFEREQLASEMHNGVAQDLAFVGFGLDALGRSAGLPPDVATEVHQLRSEVSRMLEDIRLSIGDLRVGVRADQGVGRVLSTQVQHFGATTGAAVQVELRESTIRLPVEVELGLARLTHELLMDARAGRATCVRVVLESEPPLATYLLEHDGRSAWDDDGGLAPALSRFGGGVRIVRPDVGSGVAVVVHVGDLPDEEPAVADVGLDRLDDLQDHEVGA
jgi:signal transduction histidine kinase